VSLNGVELLVADAEEALKGGQGEFLPEGTVLLDRRYASPDRAIPHPERFLDILPAPLPVARLAEALLRAISRLQANRQVEESLRSVKRAEADREELLAISAALSEEH